MPARKEEIRRMFALVGTWSKELAPAKPDDIRALSESLRDAEHSLQQVLAYWPDDYGSVISVTSEPIKSH